MNITLKNQDESALMRYAGKVLGAALFHLKEMIKPGVNCLELDKFFKEFINKYECKSNFKGYLGFPAYTCISINEQLIHTIPSNYSIKNGDIVSIDAGCSYKGYHADAAFSVICGDSKDPEHQRLLKTTEESLNLAIKQVVPGTRVGNISSTIENFVVGEGYYLPTEFSGHGIGKSMHEDPMIPNQGIPNSGVRLREGMAICIEPMVQIGTSKVKMLKDGWTIVSENGKATAHFEHTILVTKTGHEVLTTIKPMED
ncbi:type I methionyl aminopeptidase [Spiroplasma endosymbiont of Othius punctulatus]|uniref:type I methionyl aminopeptidase n=1 Tax=Spiroplasma endosymbiont of Othius punctulatus TaxID=3066289 RepID=UPI0030CC301A